MEQSELFADYEIKEGEKLYVIGNGFDVHHWIDSKYTDFKEWVRKNKDADLIGLMDTFFSNECDFWADIENALGDYREDEITEFCEPESSEDFRLEHPGQWQAGVEDGIPYIFGNVMDRFRDAFNEWVRSIDIDGIEADLQLPAASKYLTFNYTETLEWYYHIPEQNVLHIHGNRLAMGEEFVLGHGNSRDVNEPYGDEGQLLPYQNAYSAVIEVMNQWLKNPKGIIERHKDFFKSLSNCKAVSVMGLSYNDIDMPYLKEVAANVAQGAKWWLYYYSDKDYKRAMAAAGALGLKDYCLKRFD